MGRTATALGLAFLVLPCAARAATPIPGTPETAAHATPAEREWSFALYLDGYAQPGEKFHLTPTVFADRGSLHLEARYNYEDLETGSVFVGWSFPFGDDRAYLTLTPIVGGVFGRTAGVAPGVEVDARWWRLSLWLEAEYLFDTKDASASYLYSWSELDYVALSWLWFGVSVQRLRTVDSPRSVEAGPALGFGKKDSPGWSLTFYAYGLARSAPWYLATLALQF